MDNQGYLGAYSSDTYTSYYLCFLIPLFNHVLYLPLISPSHPFSIFALYLPSLYSNSSPVLVYALSATFYILTSPYLQATFCCLIFLFSLPPTSLVLPPFLARFPFYTGWGNVLLLPLLQVLSGTSLSHVLNYVFQCLFNSVLSPRIFSFSGFL